MNFSFNFFDEREQSFQPFGIGAFFHVGDYDVTRCELGGDAGDHGRRQQTAGEQRAVLDTLTDLSSELELSRLLQTVVERAVALLRAKATGADAVAVAVCHIHSSRMAALIDQAS